MPATAFFSWAKAAFDLSAAPTRLCLSKIVAAGRNFAIDQFTVLSRNDGPFPLILSETRRKNRRFLTVGSGAYDLAY